MSSGCSKGCIAGVIVAAAHSASAFSPDMARIAERGRTLLTAELGESVTREMEFTNCDVWLVACADPAQDNVQLDAHYKLAHPVVSTNRDVRWGDTIATNDTALVSWNSATLPTNREVNCSGRVFQLFVPRFWTNNVLESKLRGFEALARRHLASRKDLPSESRFRFSTVTWSHFGSVKVTEIRRSGSKLTTRTTNTASSVEVRYGSDRPGETGDVRLPRGASVTMDEQGRLTSLVAVPTTSAARIQETVPGGSRSN